LLSDAVLRWNTVALGAAQLDTALGRPHEQPGPTRLARALAIVQAAVYDSVNSINGAYQPYLVDDTNVAPDASIDAAVAQAAHDTLAALYPSQQAIFDADLTADLAAIPAGPAQDGAAVGQFVAAQILAARQNDGSSDPMMYTPGTQPGQWQPDPLHPSQMALTPDWGNVTPFTMTSSAQFLAPPPPALNSPEYTAAFNEVESLGGDGVTTPTQRTAEQTEIAIFWGYDGSPGLGTPPVMYNQIAQTIAVEMHNSEIENARMFALINLAMGDAGIASWQTKYTYSFWRPITAIRDAAATGNPDTTADLTWAPLGAPADNGAGTNFTPPFPAYTSGHATFGGALFRMLADFYGTDHIAFTIGSDEFNGVTRDQNGNVRPVVTRSFTSLSQAMEENGQSRIYLGIHWSFDKVNGINQGEAIADQAFAKFLRPRTPLIHLAVGAGPGAPPLVLVYAGAGPLPSNGFLAFPSNFTGGVRTAVGDVNGDGIPDIVAGAGPGAVPGVEVFDGHDGHLIYGFLAFPVGFSGGVNVAVGDVNGDGDGDIIVSADAGSLPVVAVYSGKDLSLLDAFFAYDPSFRGGVRVAEGRQNNGQVDLITGAGPGAGPLVQVYRGSDLALLQSFFAFDPAFRGGVFVSAGDVMGTGQMQVIASADAGGMPVVKVFDLTDAAAVAAMLAFVPTFTGGVRVGIMDLNNGDPPALVVAAGAGGVPAVRVLNMSDQTDIDGFLAFDLFFRGGVFVAGV
jgi:hypothetical protein